MRLPGSFNKKIILKMKTFLIFLSRNKAYTLINILGLSLSLMFVILIGAYTWQEYHVNSQYPKEDRILVYGLEMSRGEISQTASGGNWNLQKYFKTRYPDIESSCAIYGGKDNLNAGFIDKDGQRESFPTLMVDSTFFTMFDIPMIVGDARTALANRNDAVVTDEFARRVYGSPEKAIGKQLNLEDTLRFRITAVIPAIEHSSIPEADVFLRFENVAFYNQSLTAETMNNANGAEVLFLELPGAHLEKKTADMDEYQKQFFWIFQNGDITNHTTLTPLSKYYFAKSDDSACFKHGDRNLVDMLLAIGIVILLFAVFNYINLTNALSERRMREMAMRRLVGASRGSIIRRIIMESEVLCILSMIIAIALTWAFRPYMESLLSTKLTLIPAGVGGIGRIMLVIAFTLLLGALTGLLPAMVMSKVKAIDIVKGSASFHKPHASSLKPQISSVFIVAQNVATIVFIAVALSMSAQIHHMITLYRGYNTKNVISIGMSPGGSDDRKAIDSWYDGLKQLPQVVAATACCGTPYSGGNNQTYVYNGKTISSQVIYGDSQFFKVFGLKLASRTGLKNGEGAQVYVNRQMLAEESLPMNSNYYYLGNSKGNTKKESVSGVLQDFTIRTLDTEQTPLRLYIVNDSIRSFQWGTAILIQDDPVTAYESIQKLFKKITRYDLKMDMPYLDQQIASDYQNEIRMATILRLFAFIAIVISVLGLVAMSTYYIDGRKKEIAVRKVFGSTSAEVSRRFIRRFLSYVVIAFVIAIPLIVYFYGGWVSQYSHRAVWWYWIPIGGIIVLAVSYSAVYVQVRKAARHNPAINLKSE